MGKAKARKEKVKEKVRAKEKEKEKERAKAQKVKVKVRANPLAKARESQVREINILQLSSKPLSENVLRKRVPREQIALFGRRVHVGMETTALVEPKLLQNATNVAKAPRLTPRIAVGSLYGVKGPREEALKEKARLRRRPRPKVAEAPPGNTPVVKLMDV